jgi:hypothetical protein
MADAMAGRNVGGLDQSVRIAMGTMLVTMWIFGPLGWWGALGLLPLVTGLTRVCPIYPLLGLNTCPAPPPAAEAAPEATPEATPEAAPAAMQPSAPARGGPGTAP